jgi:hypothetical protein
MHREIIEFSTLGFKIVRKKCNQFFTTENANYFLMWSTAPKNQTKHTIFFMSLFSKNSNEVFAVISQKKQFLFGEFDELNIKNGPSGYHPDVVRTGDGSDHVL